MHNNFVCLHWYRSYRTGRGDGTGVRAYNTCVYFVGDRTGRRDRTGGALEKLNEMILLLFRTGPERWHRSERSHRGAIKTPGKIITKTIAPGAISRTLTVPRNNITSQCFLHKRLSELLSSSSIPSGARSNGCVRSFI
ncbi:unnamed protein product, partial [Ectocarpus sp. 4 AP-2014]